MRNNFTLPTDLTFPNYNSTGHDEFTTGAGPTAFGMLVFSLQHNNYAFANWN